MTKDELISRIGEILRIKDPQKQELQELYHSLRLYRAELHPDNYVDDKLKLESEKQFKEITPLLEQLELEVEREQQSRLPAKVTKAALEKPASIFTDIKLRHLEDEVDNLREQNQLLTFTIDQLKEQLDDAKKEIARRFTDLAREKISPANIPQKVSIGITGLLAILTTFSKDLFGILNQFQAQSVIPTYVIPVAFWTLFILFTIVIGKQEYKKARLTRFLENLYTAEIRHEFFRSLDNAPSFDEASVVEFIRSRTDPLYGMFPRRRLFLRWFFPRFTSRSDMEYLSRAFLAKLDEDKLVSYIGSSQFQRCYHIVDNVSPYWSRK
jgi:hypothetical protein